MSRERLNVLKELLYEAQYDSEVFTEDELEELTNAYRVVEDK